jgi:hypothetical protein
MVEKITKPVFKTDKGKIYETENYARHVELYDNFIEDMNEMKLTAPWEFLNWISDKKELVREYLNVSDGMMKDIYK